MSDITEVYVSADGTEFDDEDDYKSYIVGKELDEFGDELTFFNSYKCRISNEDVFLDGCETHYVVVKTERAAAWLNNSETYNDIGLSDVGIVKADNIYFYSEENEMWRSVDDLYDDIQDINDVISDLESLSE